ncbi:MAG: Uncharacterized protein G01um101466_490 [Parcubacteria group bacterium Gr01-1014_66]|nr:MAG: Uncharacterized protein G01um101466_490 [Parcubacteria group bacterium Gr01-1014_66]
MHEKHKSHQVSGAHKWLKRSVAHKMFDRVPVVPDNFTIGETNDFLKTHIHEFETINYIYITDDTKKLKGILSVKDLFRKNPDVPVLLQAHQDLVVIYPETEQREAASLALRHNIKAVPVVDHEGKFLGAVTGDQILEILNREFREDVLRKAGIRRSHMMMDNILEIPLWTGIVHRLPWLLVGLGGGIVAAGLIARFEEILATNLILAAFIPLIVYIADAVGTQLEAFVIRDFSISRKLNFGKYFLKQFILVGTIGLILGGLIATVTNVLYPDSRIAFIIGIAVLGAVLSSLLTGLLIPFLFRNLRLDPANASGPIATILQDILSILIYFAIASRLLS